MIDFPPRPATPRLASHLGLAPHLRAFWSPTLIGGAKLPDLSGQGRWATPNSTSFMAVARGPFGPCVDLTGIGYYDVDSAPARPLLTAGVPFTLSWWERVNSGTVGSNLNRFWFTVSGAPGNGFVVGRSDTTSIGCVFFGGAQSGGNGYHADSTTIVPATTTTASAGVWRHFAVVGRGGPTSLTTSDYSAYLDGQPLTVATCSFGGLTAAANRIGAGPAMSGTNAVLDAISLFSVALSSSQVETYLRRDPFALVRPRGNPGAGIVYSTGGPPASAYRRRVPEPCRVLSRGRS